LPRQSIALASRTACDSLTVSKMALAPTCGWAGGTCVNAAGRGRDACAAGAHQIVAKDCSEQLATERLLGTRALGGGTAERWPLLRLCEHAHAAEEQRGTEQQPGHWRKTERGNADSDASGGLTRPISSNGRSLSDNTTGRISPGNGTASQVGWRSFPARSRSSRA
jgi:hypothetical protein